MQQRATIVVQQQQYQAPVYLADNAEMVIVVHTDDCIRIKTGEMIDDGG